MVGERLVEVVVLCLVPGEVADLRILAGEVLVFLLRGEGLLVALVFVGLPDDRFVGERFAGDCFVGERGFLGEAFPTEPGLVFLSPLDK